MKTVKAHWGTFFSGGQKTERSFPINEERMDSRIFINELVESNWKKKKRPDIEKASTEN